MYFSVVDNDIVDWEEESKFNLIILALKPIPCLDTWIHVEERFMCWYGAVLVLPSHLKMFFPKELTKIRCSCLNNTVPTVNSIMLLSIIF